MGRNPNKFSQSQLNEGLLGYDPVTKRQNNNYLKDLYDVFDSEDIAIQIAKRSERYRQSVDSVNVSVVQQRIAEIAGQARNDNR